MTTTVYTPITAPPPGGGRLRQFGLRSLVAASALIGALLLVSSYVFAQLNAVATQANNAQVGTLSLTMASNGYGLSTDFGITGPTLEPMVPGDQFLRAVDLTNGGNLAGTNLRLWVESPASNRLVDSTHGLTAVVETCDSAWTYTGTRPTGSWSCSGTRTTVLASTTIATLISTGATLTGHTALSAGEVLHLLFTITLPGAANTETTTNGTPSPNPGIQGNTAALTWKFTEDQRAAATVQA